MEQARQGEVLQDQVKDASRKVGLLHGELVFNKSLEAKLEKVQAIQKSLDLVERALLDDRLLECVDLIRQVEEELDPISVPRISRVADALGARATDLRDDVVEKLTGCWKAYISVDAARSSIKISRNLSGRPSDIFSSDLRLILFQTLLQ